MFSCRLLALCSLLAASLSADTVLTSDSFTVVWGHGTLAYSSDTTGITASGTVNGWAYTISAQTNLTDALTFLSPLTLDLSNATFTCETSDCDATTFAITSIFSMDLTDPLFASPLPYSVSMATTGPGLYLSTWDYGPDFNSHYYFAISPPTYSFSGSGLLPTDNTGTVAELQLYAQYTLPAVSASFSSSMAISLGYNAAPEAGTGLLVAAGLAGSLAWRRLRRRS
jgi:hypothetical protein